MESKTASEKEKRDLSNYSFAKVFKALANSQTPDGLEREMDQEGRREFLALNKTAMGFTIPSIVLNQRASLGQNVTTAGDGGSLVQSDPLIFIEALKNALVLVQMGAMFLPGLVGKLPLVKGGAFSGAWLAEGDNISIYKEAFELRFMTPKNYRAYGAVSKLLLLQTDGVFETIFRQELINTLALALEQAAINGAGDPAPTGILNTAGIKSVLGGIDGAVPTWENIVDLEGEILGANGKNNISYLTNSKVVSKLKKTLKQANVAGYIIDGDLMNGAKVYCTNAVPSNLVKGDSGAVCSAIIAGNFSQMLIGMWGGIDLVVDPVTQADKGEIRFFVNQFVDVALRNEESFSAMKDAIT